MVRGMLVRDGRTHLESWHKALSVYLEGLCARKLYNAFYRYSLGSNAAMISPNVSYFAYMCSERSSERMRGKG